MGDEERTEQPLEGPAKVRADHMRELDKARRNRVAKILVALILMVIFVLFVIRNSDPVSKSSGVDFVFFTRDARLIWVFLVCGILGGLIGYLLGRPSKLQRRMIRDAERLALKAEPPRE